MAPDDTQGLIEVRLSDVDEFREKARVLMLEHHREVVLQPQIQKLNPNWPKYYELELRRELAILAGWAGPRMVGYSMNFWSDHLHDADLRVFHNDAIFVRKAHRGAGLGKMLLDRTEAAARQAQCQIMHTHAKPGSTLARMLGGAGFKGEPSQALLPGWYVQDIVFSKVLV